MADAMPYRAPLTLAELDEVERETDTRHELVDGVAYAMVGGTVQHGAVITGMAVAFSNRLHRPCQVLSESTRSHMASDISDDYLYPDVMIVCDPTDRAPRPVDGDGTLDLPALSLSIPVRDFYAQADL